MMQTFICRPHSRRALTRLLRLILVSVLFAYFIPLPGNNAFAQAPFTCQNDVSYRIQGNPSALYSVSLRTGTATLLLSAATLGNRNLQGLGYNPVDNFLYASVSGTNSILKIGSDGISTLITVPTLSAAAYAAGDVGPDGTFYLYVPSATTLAKINLSTLAVTTITLTTGNNLQDISISADGASIYGISTTNGSLVRYATSGGAATVTDVGFDAGLSFSTYFGSYSAGSGSGNSRGNLYAIDNATSSVYTVVGPDIPLGQSATQVSPTLATAITNTDGARCIKSLATVQAAFVCTAGQAFIVTGTQGYPTNSCNDEGNSVLAEYNLQTGTLVSTSTQLINSFNTRTTINNLGYNVTDGRLWGYRNGTNQLIRIGAGRTVDYFAIDGLSNDCIYGDQNINNTVFVAGDVSLAGVMYLFNGFNGDRFIRVDLNPASPTYLQKLSDVVVSGATLVGSNGVKDLAFNPIDNQLYGIRGSDDHLLRVNPTTGAATDLGQATGIGTLGSGDFLVTFFDNLGAFYTQRSGGDDVYKIPNVSTGNRTGSVFIANGASIGGNGDGARCPFSTIESYTISGTVFNDANGLLGSPANTVDGTAVSSLAGNTLSANLVNTSGNVVATTTLTSGTFSFTGVSGNSSFSVVLTNTPGTLGSPPPATTLTGLANTGEFVGTGAGSDGTPNGVVSVSVAAANVANVKLGVDRLPVADIKTATAQLNPGGSTRVTVPTLTGSDPEDGAYTGASLTNTVVIQSLPSTGTLFYNGSAVTADQVIANYNPSLLTVDPVDGPVSVTFTYSERDAAGKDSPAALVTIPFTGVSISGTVFDDANGLVDGIVNGTAVSSLAGNTFSANLVGPGGTVLATTLLTSGTYSFTGITANTSYSVVLSNSPGTVGAVPPSNALTGNAIYTGETIGMGAGNDGTPNGAIVVAVGSNSVTNVNFGVNVIPSVLTATDTPRPNPGASVSSPVSATVFRGNDPEDGTYGNNLTGRTVTLYPANNGTLYYNNTRISSLTAITNFDPTKVSIAPTTSGATTGDDPDFLYAVNDNAGATSSPQLVIVPFTAPLISLSGSVFNDVNGNVSKDAGEVNINGPGLPVYASLVNAGSVVATVAVSSTGGYTFSAVSPNSSYSVVLTTTAAGSATPSLPASWTNTGEKLGLTGSADGAADGILAVTVASTNVTEANFGIEQRPTAGSGVNTVSNPGGTSPVTVPPSTFTNTAASTDVAPGTVVALRVVAFPSNTTSLTIGNTVYTASSPEFSGPNPPGVEVDTDNKGIPVQTFQVDPTNDSQPVSIPFRVLDNALKASANVGTAVLNFTAPVSISGAVLNDLNGLADNTVNGTPVSKLQDNTFYVSLVNGTGTVVASASLTSGTYSFTGLAANSSYTVVLSNTPGRVGSAPPSTTLSTGVINTGETIGTAAGSDGTPDGVISVTVGTASVTNVDFGVRAFPDLTPVIYARPSTVSGTTAISYVIDVFELFGLATSGAITVKVSKDALTALGFNSALTTVGGRPVQNNVWSFSGPSGGFYTLTTNQVIPAGGLLSFGLTGTLTPGATTGTLTASVVIVAGSGSEVVFENNSDADKIDYFQQ